MIDDSKQLCDILETLPASDRENVICVVSLAILGRPFHDISDLRLQFAKIESLGVDSGFLVSSTLKYLIEWYEPLADPTRASTVIDNCLAKRSQLRAELEKPAHQRQPPIPDDQLVDLINKFEDSMSRLTETREDNRRILSWLNDLLERVQVSAQPSEDEE